MADNLHLGGIELRSEADHAGVFQRALNQLDRDRVHLGNSGLSSSDLVSWLRNLPTERLLAFADDCLPLPLRGQFLQDGIALDIAEFELLERERQAHQLTSMPGASEAPATDQLPIVEDDLALLGDWHGELSQLREATALEQIVPSNDYARSAYRLSLLGLLGDPESAALDGPAADIARLTLRWAVGLDLTQLDHPAVAAISRGELLPTASAAISDPSLLEIADDDR